MFAGKWIWLGATVTSLMLMGHASSQDLTTDQQCSFWGAMGSKIAQLRDEGVTIKQTRAKYSAGLKNPKVYSDANRQYAQAIIGLTYNDFRSLSPDKVATTITQACQKLMSDQLDSLRLRQNQDFGRQSIGGRHLGFRLCRVILTLTGASFSLAVMNVVSADDALQRKCFAMGKIARDIMMDRDEGVPYKTRQKRNQVMAGDMPSLETFLRDLTKVVYTDESNLTPTDIALTTVEACLKNG